MFNIIAYFHRKVNDSINRHEIWLQIKSTQVARMTLDWAHIPVPANSEPNPEHPFEIDLELTGKTDRKPFLYSSAGRASWPGGHFNP
ncbi:MAG: hypothetical protein ACE5HI_08410 [bacterium]